jgi:RimJ/RimL family protein N-acetyltransferase
MDISPCTDVAFLNRVANDKSVRPYLGLGDGYMDTQWVLDVPGTIFLANEYGGFLLLQTRPGLYSIHSLFLPEGRGAKAVRAALDAVAWVFQNTDAKAITTEVPAPNLAAKWLALRCGFTEISKRPQSWIAPNGEVSDMTDYLLTKPRWEERSAKGRVQ